MCVKKSFFFQCSFVRVYLFLKYWIQIKPVSFQKCISSCSLRQIDICLYDFFYSLAIYDWKLYQLKEYVQACKKEGVEFRKGEFKLWVNHDECWSDHGKGFNRQVEAALKNLDNLTLNPKSQKSKSSRMSDVYVDEEHQKLLNVLSDYKSDEEKYEHLISTACLLKPELKSRLKMVSSLVEILTHIKNKRSAHSLGLKDCILGSILGDSVKTSDLEKIGNIRVRSEKVDALREARKKLLNDEIQTFINTELYASSRRLPDAIRHIIEAFLLDDDVTQDNSSGRRLFFEGKMKPIRVLYTLNPENTKDLFDS